MINVAIVGATGLVGSTFLKVLEEKNLNIDSYTLLASKKSKGKKIKFMGYFGVCNDIIKVGIIILIL